MTTQPTNHRAEAGIQLSVARDDPQSDPIGLGILHGILALHDLLVEIRDEDDPEPRHRLEVDEDDPDTLADDDDTVEQRFGLAYIDDVGGEYQPGDLARYGYPAAEPADRPRLSGFAAIHRHDDFGYPWGAA